MIRLPTDLLQPDMILSKSVIDERGHVLLRQGVYLTDEYISTLKRRGFASVYINDGDTDDVIIEDIISDEVQRKAQANLARIFDFIEQVSADFSNNQSDEVIAALRDTGVADSLRGHSGFKELGGLVTSLLDEIFETEMLTSISQIRSYDDVIFSHSINVAVTALMIGKRLSINHQDLKRLGVGAMLHDIGKIFTSSATTGDQQTTSRSTIDQNRLREHPRLGYELLRARNPDAVMTNHVALQHHERQDGLGFPRGLRGTNTIKRPSYGHENILLISEIAAVADMYDILSVDRPGHTALTPKQVANTMRRLAGCFLNREIVEHFLSILPILPAGINIIVQTGRYEGYQGIVVQANNDQPEQPLIRLLYDRHDERITPIDLDLARDQSIKVEAILRQ